MPDVFTTFFTDSVWTWVETIVNADGRSGEIGTGIGRVEFSTCKDIDPYKNSIHTDVFQLSNVPAVSLLSSILNKIELSSRYDSNHDFNII